jgi:hypothetical protein
MAPVLCGVALVSMVWCMLTVELDQDMSLYIPYYGQRVEDLALQLLDKQIVGKTVLMLALGLWTLSVGRNAIPAWLQAIVSVLLIAVIQGSIWINFSIPTLTGQPLYFLGYLIVNAIQMGANIDYAIVISSHYQEHKANMPHKQAIILALNEAFPTVFTSGTMLASAGLLIGNLSAQPVVSIMGNCIGRGTIISMILVLFVLPSILVLGDSIIERTKFRIKTPELLPTRTASGTMRVQGHLRGYISGMIDGDFNGILHGQLNAAVSTDGILETQEEGGEETCAKP